MKRTMTKRFYVASNKMTDGTADRYGWMRILPDAINEAKTRLLNHSHLECVYVVEVVRIVRRENPPIVVEEVRRER